MDPGSDASVIAASLAEPEAFGALFDRHAPRAVPVSRPADRTGRGRHHTRRGLPRRLREARRRMTARAPMRDRGCTASPPISSPSTAAVRRVASTRPHGSSRQRAPIDDIGDRVDSLLDAADLWPHVADAITDLPEVERDVLILFVWEDLSYGEIADALDVPAGTVRSRLNRARMRMRELRGVSGREE